MCSLWFTYSNIYLPYACSTHCTYNMKEDVLVSPLYKSLLTLQSTDLDRLLFLPETWKGTERLARTLPRESFIHEGGLISWPPLVYTYRQEILTT